MGMDCKSERVREFGILKTYLDLWWPVWSLVEQGVSLLVKLQGRDMVMWRVWGLEDSVGGILRKWERFMGR